MGTTAEATARYLIYLASQGDEPSPVTHLQIQKLLYYAQGWSLALRGAPLFTGRLEAWVHGPVVPEVFPVFADCGNTPIPPHEGRDSIELSTEERRLIEMTWHEYGRFSAWHLRDKTHAEAPWREARKGVPDNVVSKTVISHESLRTFFRGERAARARKLGFTIDQIEQALRSARSGDVMPFADVMRGLGHEVAS